MILFCIFAFAGCGQSPQEETPAAAVLPFYLIFSAAGQEEAVFLPEPEFFRLIEAGPAPTGDSGLFRPWVGARRGVQFHHTGERTFLSINGLGVAELLAPSAEREKPELLLFPSGALFSGRTLGNSFVYNDKIVCQVYEDTVFSDSQNHGGPSLVVFSPKTGGYSSLRLELGPPWELVECLPRKDLWFLGFKSVAAEKEVAFRYFSYNPELHLLEEISVENYRRAFHPVDIAAAPEALRTLVLSCLGGQNEEVMLFRVLQDGVNRPAFYISGSLEELRRGEAPGLEYFARERNEWRLMDPKGKRIYGIEQKDKEKTDSISLPSLPPGFVFTEFIWDNRGFWLSWEEQKFPLTGRAGLVFYPWDWEK